jgi:hypothetical protein
LHCREQHLAERGRLRPAAGPGDLSARRPPQRIVRRNESRLEVLRACCMEGVVTKPEPKKSVVISAKQNATRLGPRSCHEISFCTEFKRFDWLAFLNTYRTMCIAPNLEFHGALEQIRIMKLAA